MAERTPLDEKLGEVLGLAQAAQDATKRVGGMQGADAFEDDAEGMGDPPAETARRTGEPVDGIDAKKTAIREKARETKGEATDVRRLAGWAIDVQREHVEKVREASPALAAEKRARDGSGQLSPIRRPSSASV